MVENTQQLTPVSGCLCFPLDIMVQSNVWVGCGYPIGNDELWLDGHTIANNDKTVRFLVIKFGQRMALLAKHLHVFCEKRPIPE